jgi:hypothetical protein
MKTMKSALLVLGICFTVCAQADGLDDARGKREAIMMGLYPPDIIMKHQQRLGITDAQRRSISGAVQTFQIEVADLQWDLQNAQQLLQQSLTDYPVKVGDAMLEVETVLGLEAEFKLAHFKMLIAIKNELNAEQVDVLTRGIKNKLAQNRQ